MGAAAPVPPPSTGYTPRALQSPRPPLLDARRAAGLESHRHARPEGDAERPRHGAPTVSGADEAWANPRVCDVDLRFKIHARALVKGNRKRVADESSCTAIATLPEISPRQPQQHEKSPRHHQHEQSASPRDACRLPRRSAKGVQRASPRRAAELGQRARVPQAPIEDAEDRYRYYNAVVAGVWPTRQRSEVKPVPLVTANKVRESLEFLTVLESPGWAMEIQPHYVERSRRSQHLLEGIDALHLRLERELIDSHAAGSGRAMC